jgi:hypothetical protein
MVDAGAVAISNVPSSAVGVGNTSRTKGCLVVSWQMGPTNDSNLSFPAPQTADDKSALYPCT